MRRRTSLWLITLILALAGAGPAGDIPDDGEEGEEEAPPALTTADIPTRIAMAEVGDWVLYRTADGSRSKLIVVEKWEDHGDTYLIIRNEVQRPKRRRPVVSEERVSVRDAVRDLRALGPDDLVTRSEVLVLGKKMEAVVINYYEDGELARQSYLSDLIPVHGLIRGVNTKKKERNALTIVDFGFSEDYE